MNGDAGRHSVGQSAAKLDGEALVRGAPAFTDDVVLPGMLYGAMLRSPHAHARILGIDVARARALKGVHAVLTWEDVPRVAFARALQSYPEPSPPDGFVLDRKVRHIGDRVALVAAESPELAARACEAIRVEYEVLPAVVDFERAQAAGVAVIHDEPGLEKVLEPERNLVCRLGFEAGDPDGVLAAADCTVAGEYRVSSVTHAHLEPHVAITYLDADGRLVVRASTQAPFHVRRILARIFDLPLTHVRVYKPRMGGGFGAKQEMLLEDACTALTLATGRAVRMEFTRHEEFTDGRRRHPQRLRMRTGFDRDGKIVANEMVVLADTGSYGSHASTVNNNTGGKVLPLYPAPNLRFACEVVYTNLMPSGAYRGYGCPQGFFALEGQMDRAAAALGMDPLELRLRNHIREGDVDPVSRALDESGRGVQRVVRSCALAECIRRGAEEIGWNRRGRERGEGVWRRGIGMACAMQGSGIPGIDWGAATVTLNDDGTFTLLTGATDLGTGSDTVLAQIAGEVLGVGAGKFHVRSADTDTTPFDVGAYASSTTHVSGNAVRLAAEALRDKLLASAGRLLDVPVEDLALRGGEVAGGGDRRATLGELALHAMYKECDQLSGSASWRCTDSPPPFAATFVDLSVDTETGQVRVHKVVTYLDCGTIVNPILAEGQVEGAIVQGLGYALTEEMVFTPEGRVANPHFLDYKIATFLDVPEIVTRFIETNEPHGPFGAKAVGEVAINTPAPAVAAALHDAVGVWMNQVPMSPERVLAAIEGRRETS